MEKVLYLIRSALLLVFKNNMDCPNCGHLSKRVIDRKYLFTTLRRCPSCCLLYRTPRDPKGRGLQFYQKTYRQGFTTETPDENELRELIKTQFRGGPRDYSSYLDLLGRLGVMRGSEVLEYGCSWGYGAWQMKNYGYKVQAYEISEPRCRYAREKLGIQAVTDPESIQGPFDLVFSAHVLEHVDQLEGALASQLAWLKTGGFLVGITPNGSSAFRKAHPQNFHRLWGLVHPQLLDDEFLRKRFAGMDLRIGSLASPENGVQLHIPNACGLRLDKWELAFVVRKGTHI